MVNCRSWLLINLARNFYHTAENIISRHFCVHKLVTSLHTVDYEVFMKPEESAECHQTLSSEMQSRDETTCT